MARARQVRRKEEPIAKEVPPVEMRGISNFLPFSLLEPDEMHAVGPIATVRADGRPKGQGSNLQGPEERNCRIM